jgi:hypothetical protein
MAPHLTVYVLAVTSLAISTSIGSAQSWCLGTPIVSYWDVDLAPTSDAKAQQLSDGGWNLAWCTEAELDSLHRRGLRALLNSPVLYKYNCFKNWDGLLKGTSPEEVADRRELEALVSRVKSHPAMYAYFVCDEPHPEEFSSLANMVAFMRAHDPEHLAFVNLLPGGSGNQLAYADYLAQFITIAKPGVVSYDRYPFTACGDHADVFLNLALVRDASLKAGLPFVQCVQSCKLNDTWRAPSAEQMRWQLYSCLAYGGQGVFDFLYACPNVYLGCWTTPPPPCTDGIVDGYGSPTPLYYALSTLNREFIHIAAELQGLISVGVHHAGFVPVGGVILPVGSAFRFDPPISSSETQWHGAMLGCFSSDRDGSAASATHALVVNIDYGSERTVGVRGPGPLWVYNASDDTWIGGTADLVQLRLPPGGGVLVSTRILLYVDGQHVGCEDGSYTCPFQTIGAAYRAAGGGETLSVAAGNYGERLRMAKAVRLVSRNGTARVGAR